VRSAVLAGGGATRFGGRPKGLERVGGSRILDRLVATIHEATGSAPFLVANAPDAATWLPTLSVVRDARPHCGSLGGIYSALTAGPGPVLVTAWDMPFLTSGLLRAVVDGADGYDVFLPEGGNRRGVEPLCAVYGAACEPAIRRHLDEEDFRAIGFHADVRVGTLALDRVAAFGDPGMLFFNVNSADDLERAEDLWRQHA
jgi:molybdopterin-guanine dinucleotide biosynthesis protein A